ncbi:MAG: DUF2309 domain-containing protein [Sphingobacteriaceae bacterium]|nr:DUF2309 domain-containing protein [Sphingobacteriaceae bacterium]
MSPKDQVFDEAYWLHELQHYLPAQAPLKDFVHHNTLHAFQDLPFHQGMEAATNLFGYQTYADPAYYLEALRKGQITHEQLEKRLKKAGAASVDELIHQLHALSGSLAWEGEVGQIRKRWHERHHLNLDKAVHPLLFRTLGSYLDQGFATWAFPRSSRGFLASLRELDRQSYYRIFKHKRVRALLKQPGLSLERVLQLLVGRAAYFGPYLVDMAFAHPGWSGMVATLEQQPDSLLDQRKITLREFLLFELLLELDAVYARLGDHFMPLMNESTDDAPVYFGAQKPLPALRTLAVWQEALEWSYFDQVLAGMADAPESKPRRGSSFQAFFCIDDRECSLRRHLEALDADAATYGTPGFFQIDAMYQPEGGKFMTKICPAPMQPAHVLHELPARGKKTRQQTDWHFSRRSHGLLGGWLTSQTLGFSSAVRLAANIFRPGESPATVSAFRHMARDSKLNLRYKGESHHGLQLGYTVIEMADRVERLLRSTGLVSDFAPLIYVVSHGASSVNNTHYAGYDCGACSGRPGSVNARAIAEMANDAHVRELLAGRGLHLPVDCRFVPALHDTTRDELVWYDEKGLSEVRKQQHERNKSTFEAALQCNARERARRFVLIDIQKPVAQVHEAVKKRALSLFEPRPELNHATNALCIVGRRSLTDHLFLDRRAFMNSYDASADPDASLLLGILQAATPVCGGINLEYYFSRVDPDKLGAGSKLPHNVMGLIGVANGMDGDLRPGLPTQMIEVHDPLRLLMIVERAPDELLDTLSKHPPTLDWYRKQWVLLVAVDPQSKSLYRFEDDAFVRYRPQAHVLPELREVESVVLATSENLPVMRIQQEEQL